jgi:type I restriction enzyme S subunit
MNPEQLLQHFERISEAPDAIPRLRRFILDLAVRGKLVEQDPNDEPAAELLKSIAKHTGKSLDAINKPDTDEPFELPIGWKWSQLGLVTTKTGSGSTPRGGQAVYQSEGIPFLRSQNIYNDGLRLNDVAYIAEETHAKMSGTAVEPGDLLLNITGGSIGRCCRIPDDPFNANISQHVAIIRLAVSGMVDFSHKLVLSPFFQSYVIDEQTGAGRGGLPKNRMDKIPFPLPPLAEQHRIVAKVDELMALCDQLQAAQTEREQSRDRLVAASLHSLNPPADDEAANTPETQREHARFIFNHLPRLTTRPAHIKQLRQTILNLAVRGKLVPQDPNDEPAIELLKRIQAEKMLQRPRNQSEKGKKDLKSLDSDSISPLGWRMVDFSDYALEISTGPFGSALHQSEYVLDGIPLVNPSHMVNGRIQPDRTVTVSADTANRLASYRMKDGDIVMARRGEVGRAALVTEIEDGWLCGTGSFFLRFHSEVFREYIILLLQSQSVRRFLAGEAVGITMGNLNHGILKRMPLAIPPLAEQHRIVAKVDELMALCDQLETQLTSTAADRRRLLEAVLHEALSPAAEQAA